MDNGRLTERQHAQLTDLVLQSLEYEARSVEVYEAALRCVANPELEQEWRGRLSSTREHVEVLRQICAALSIDVDQRTPGTCIARHLGLSLVMAMDLARMTGKGEAAQMVACECIVLAETKRYLAWELINECADILLEGGAAAPLQNAADGAGDQKTDEHLRQGHGWSRQSWIESIGEQTKLRPPGRPLQTAIGNLGAANGTQGGMDQTGIAASNRPRITEPPSSVMPLAWRACRDA